MKMPLFSFLAALVCIGASPAQNPIPLPQNIDDTTFGPLRSGNTYVANQSVFVSGGRTLTVEPGVVVKFAASAVLQVAGVITVNGSQSQPVYFTSVRDGSVGLPVVNQPPAPGDWQRLQLLGQAPSQLRWLEVRFAGGGPSAAVTVRSDSLMEDVVISDSASNGLSVVGSMPTVRSCRFENNTGRSVDGVAFQGLSRFSGNSATGNLAGDAIRVTGGVISSAQTIAPSNLIESTLVVASILQLNQTILLTLEAGVVLKWETAGRFNVLGTLVCNGTAQDPVVFTSLADDAVGGDTGRDGPTTGSPGDWAGLAFSIFSDQSQLLRTNVRFAGGGLGGAITLDRSDLLLDDVEVRESASDGLSVRGALPTVRNCRFLDCLERSVDSAALGGIERFSNNTASGNGRGDAIRVLNGTVSVARSISVGNLIDSTLVVGGLIYVAIGGDLTVGPGVIFKFEDEDLFSVDGKLVVDGAVGAMVTFTTLADDSVGGDTGRDGPTAGAPGDWRGFRFGSSAGASELRFANVRFGGGSGANPAIDLQGFASILIDSVAVELSSGDALDLNGTFPRVRKSRFDDNLGRPTNGFQWAQLAGFVDNTAAGNAQGNLTRLISGTTGASGSDTRVEKWNTLNGDGVVVSDVRTIMNSNSSLTLGPGLILKFTNPAPNRSGFAAGAPGSRLFFDGRGYAPIVLTSITDDEHGGDTNGDGGATLPGPGAWDDVEYDNSVAASQMNHVLARFGGSGGNATVDLDASNVSIDSVRVELSATDGFRIARNGGGCRNLVAFGNTGDGIVLSATAVSLLHATVAANQGRGVVTQGTHTGAATASISWFNGNGAGDNFVGFVDSLGQPVRMFFCNGSPLHAGTQANFVTDPLFTDPNGGDLSLSLFSPCVGTAGVPNGAFTYEDHDGRSRVLDHNLFGFAAPDVGAYEYGIYNAAITGAPRLGTAVSFLVEGQPFQGNPPGAGILFFGGAFSGVGTFRPPYGNASIEQPGGAFFSVLWGFNGTPLTVMFPSDQAFLGLPLGLQVLSVQLSNIGTGNWTQAFYGTLTN